MDHSEGGRSGADLFFEKPVSGKDITEAVGRLLAAKR